MEGSESNFGGDLTDELVISMVAFTGMEKIRGGLWLGHVRVEFCFIHVDFVSSNKEGIIFIYEKMCQ